MGNEVKLRRHSIDSSASTNTLPIARPRRVNIWRPSSLASLATAIARSSRPPRILQSSPSIEVLHNDDDDDTSPVHTTSTDFGDKRPEEVDTKIKSKKTVESVVTIVVVGAKGLPDPPGDGSSNHTIICRIRLGSETVKTKAVPSSHQPQWRERLKIRMTKEQLLRVSLWDRGKHKHFMGRCVINLSDYERDRTHEMVARLDDGFGSVHLSVTICTVSFSRETMTPVIEQNLKEKIKDRFTLCNLEEWKVVGQMVVKVICAKGLNGKPNAYCKLEVDNERVQTPCVKSSSEPEWDKTFIFTVYDITSTLNLEVCDNSFMNYLSTETLGGVSIPLLRVINGKRRWYALKDGSKRNIARGACPRILLEITVFWNPVKAACRLFQPKEVVYVKKAPPKFHMGLIYNNMMFLKLTFQYLQEFNEQFKLFLEWDSRELNTLVLVVWVVFWYHFRPWAAPLLLVPPFFYFWITQKDPGERYKMRAYVNGSSPAVAVTQDEESKVERGTEVGLFPTTLKKNGTTLSEKIQSLPEITIVIASSVEYIVSLAERLYNLVSFKVPFLSYLTMLLLIGASVIFYLIPFNYLVMAFGMYKYTRKYLNPTRILNNDILDFMSRIPDNEILKDWNEIKVPEPNDHNTSAVSSLDKSNCSITSN